MTEKSRQEMNQSKRVIAEDALHSSEARFKLMVEVVKDYAIFMLDTEGRVASWNEGARRIKGYEASEIIGSSFSRFYTPEDILRQHPQEELLIATATGRFEEEGWRVKKDGSRFWASVVITRLDDKEGSHAGFVKVTRDLTERKNAEIALKKANENLEQKVLDRTRELELALNARDEFLSIASHELKTPLTSLKLQLQLTQRDLKPSSEQSLPVEKILKAIDLSVRQVNSLSNLIEDLLDISRIRTGRFTLNFEELGLSEIIEEVVARFSQQLLAAGCVVDLQLDETVRGRWDRHRLEQVITNFISNAIKYAPRSPLCIETKWEGNEAAFSVQDFGSGIPKNLHQLIFDRFERVNHDSHVGGLGLGLFIVRRIIDAHHGTVRVESEQGKGSKFIVHLPKDSESAVV